MILQTAGIAPSQRTAEEARAHQSSQLFSLRKICGPCTFCFCIFYSNRVFLDKSINKRCCWVFIQCIVYVIFYSGFNFSQLNHNYIDGYCSMLGEEKEKENYSKTNRENPVFINHSYIIYSYLLGAYSILSIVFDIWEYKGGYIWTFLL